MKYRAISLFAGVGGLDLGFEQTGKFETVWANEFDEKAALTYRSNFNNTLSTLDIHEVDKEKLPKVNIVLSGFPCQAFSVAGYRLGFEDERGDLFFETLKVINAVEPEVVFLENVKNLVGHDSGKTFRIIYDALEQHGYHIKYQTLNAKDYGDVPQNRERIYIVGFKNKRVYEKFDFPKPTELKKKLSDVIDFDNQLDERYYYTSGKQSFYDLLERDIVSQNTLYQWRRQYVRENKSNVSPTLTANMGTGGHNVPLILSNHGIRKLTPRECFNLQGFPSEYKLPDVAISHLYKQAGNSVVVPVIKRIAKKISIALEKASEVEPIQLEI
ncbi:DNA cytosine methyltransferase [Listeria seeligeri]|uniref:DNA cytosine methyltransferase n=1 Tax=Listeria seeligeri TaxID=1640 RepID=UPI0010D25211|nr:DNA cytosine methyltransferase [Listeria seeligeri]MBC1597291.1 DNA cytosine methyltransferase [Listeria seeligeri]MBC1737238.1 DNA cytosine methyltransferase [Listeria seeligeri]MBF2458897.1 DNA cytosine methyltransferase [Listeria seeligeri]MBF2539458.1 DNA cytosine methyltransferase [Listeria seeligeri]MBF2549132.1 DNA cytosine methyltransferase [Listeria seeligeri]